METSNGLLVENKQQRCSILRSEIYEMNCTNATPEVLASK
jgi:hypothetical protein